MKVTTGIVILTLAAGLVSGQKVHRDLPKFLGAEVTVTEPPTDKDGFFPEGTARVCVDLKPQKQCYTPPKQYGLRPAVSLVQVDNDTPAILFKVASGGVSGWMVHFALLRPGSGTTLDNLFLSDPSVSNQSQQAFWSEPSISRSQIFVTAEYVWGRNESHYEPHRFVISSYLRLPSTMIDSLAYHLEDEYMTVRHYDLEANADVLASEKPEILARLRKVVAANGKR